MTSQAWLLANIPGFNDLSDEERSAIQDFMFLWTYFEAATLLGNGSASAIVSIVKVWSDKKIISLDLLNTELAYFIDRYYSTGAPTPHFLHLNFRPKDRRDLVEQILRRDATDPTSITTGLLIIAFRYRNNLFHGLKWAYALEDQLGNFQNANAVMKKAIELDRASKMFVASGVADASG
jgi:hypothetical protein